MQHLLSLRPCLVLVLGIAAAASVSAQNLVPNPSFEAVIQCPTFFSQLEFTPAWFSPTQDGTPDFYHACSTTGYGVPINPAGDQAAHEGEGYVGIYLWIQSPTNAREYIEVELPLPLESGTCYSFRMHVSLADVSQFTTDDIGVSFTDAAITDVPGYPPLALQPVVVNTDGVLLSKDDWIEVSGTFTATGGERYLLIGNFNDDPQTTVVTQPSGDWTSAYAYVDDISLSPCGPTGIPHPAEARRPSGPNPFSDAIRVAVDASPGSRVRILASNGACVHDSPALPGAMIGTTDLPAGIYLLELIAPGGLRTTTRLVKQ